MKIIVTEVKINGERKIKKLGSYTIPYTARNEKLAMYICENEDLGLDWFDGETALGDEVIELQGAIEDIATFKEVFEMVA